jgi:hypothetical protein
MQRVPLHIGDGAGRVRVAMADLLIAVKSVRSLHFYDVVGRCALNSTDPPTPRLIG